MMAATRAGAAEDCVWVAVLELELLCEAAEEAAGAAVGGGFLTGLRVTGAMAESGAVVAVVVEDASNVVIGVPELVLALGAKRRGGLAPGGLAITKGGLERGGAGLLAAGTTTLLLPLLAVALELERSLLLPVQVEFELLSGVLSTGVGAMLALGCEAGTGTVFVAAALALGLKLGLNFLVCAGVGLANKFFLLIIEVATSLRDG
mmetsp:Transcript_17392/g.29133  ORF Transcript_17392/g.29133 Transcript_17392/m.29133 type:complete len:205 (+) Transcript_17392:1414-2028(+)